MALDGLMIHTLSNRMQPLVNGKIGKIQNISDEEILIHVHTKEAGNQKLIINVHSNTNRMYINNTTLQVQPSPSNFVMVLRKYVSQGIIQAIEQMGFDRIVRFSILGHNEFGDALHIQMYAELMGKYANLILVNEEGNIMDALKRIPIFENSKRFIHPGAKYTLPEQGNKSNPDAISTIQMDEPLTKQIHGFSPLTSKEFLYRMNNNETFEDILQELFESDTLYIYDTKNFHCLELKHLNQEAKVYEFMDGLNHLYQYNESKTRIKEQCGDVFRTVEKEKKKQIKKLPKLQESFEQSLDYEKYKTYGDLLFCYMYELKKEPVVIVPDFETGEDVSISIDMRYDLKENANRYYQKYHKLKRGQSILQEQIEQCKEEIEYFSQLEEQLNHCTPIDAIEIREELIKNRIMFQNKNNVRRKKPKNPHVLHLQLEEADIYVGKNNIQNNYITHHLARKQDTWFHVKDYHGSHVLIKCENLDEQKIRMCAQLATYYSKGKQSSSVPVDYTQVNQLKKVPGSKIGFVTMKSYKTIYIDPDENQIEQWIENYQVK